MRAIRQGAKVSGRLPGRSLASPGKAIPGKAFLLVAGLMLAGMQAPAGPVPGVEEFNKKAVEFPVSPSTEVWDIGNNEYLVTFKWKPAEAVTSPGVAGSFNSWNRTDLPMEGPDESGTYKVTARIPAGDYIYKFVGGSDGWFTDPGNPEKEPDGYSGHNSILSLGITALIKGSAAVKGDDKIEARATLHLPSQALYYDVFSQEDVLIRYRTLKGDVDKVFLELVARDGGARQVPMIPAGSDELFDYHEYHFNLEGENEDRVAYRFVARDGTASVASEQTWPLVLDTKRIVQTPEWAKNAVWYQIMIDRFRDGDETNNPEHTTGTNRNTTTHPWKSEWYTEQPWEREGGATFWEWEMYERLYGGDFQGVIDQLDYIKSLGVTAIYFNPVFEANNAHKYNGRSFTHADDGYGKAGEFAKSVAKENMLDPKTWEFNASDKMLLKLIDAAHERDMKIILDGVFNHLGDDAVPFVDIKEKGQKSQFANWYDIKSWEPFEYVGWGGFGGLPQFRKDPAKGFYDDTLTSYINNITKRWLDPNGDGDPRDGIDGWRLDVPLEVPRPFWEQWRQVVKETNPDAYIVAEIWHESADWLDGKTYDAVMNYPFAKASFRYFGNKSKKITVSQFDAELAKLRISYSRNVTYNLQNLFDSHDTDRWVSRLANPDMDYDAGNRIQDSGKNYMDKKPDAATYQRLRLMALFQATYVGAPMIWYGTEVGMFGADDPRTRMPMWWDDMMPYDSPDYKVDTDLREWFRTLFSLRNANPVLRKGSFMTLLTDDAKDCYAYLRYNPSDSSAFIVALNNSGSEQVVELQKPEGLAIGDGLFGAKVAAGMPGVKVEELSTGGLKVTLPAISGAAIKVGE